MTASRNLADLTTTDVERLCRPGSVALLPVGAVEQHGPHLPLGTDVVIADRLCDEVCARHGDDLDLWRLPTLPYGKSNEHLAFPGTFSLGATTVLAVLDELAAGLRRTPITTLALVNGHGGNTSLLDVACRDLRVEHGLSTFLLHALLPAEHGGPSHPEEGGLGLHAGRDETSLMLHLAPDLVVMARAARSVPEWLADCGQVGVDGPARLGWTADDLSADGTLGDPTLATAAHGAELFAGMVEALVGQLADVRRFSLPDPGGVR